MTTLTPPRPAHRATPTAMAPAAEAPVLTGADIFVRSLEAEGVEFVFGHPGGAIIKIYDAFAQLRPSFQHILVRHEQAGTHAAEGYAKATGKVGTVLVTSGPGATNTVTGIADAMMDSIPMVVFTGQVPVPLIGGDAFQEVDTMGVTRSVSKHSFQVRSAADLAPTIKAAYHIARTGRPGPVVVDLPKDILVEETPFEYPDAVEIRGYGFEHPPQPAKIERAARMIAAAQRPLFYVGGGTVSGNATERLTALARKARIPVTTTLHGLGSFPENDPLALGMLGMHGTYWANMAVQNCDLLIAVGARFDDRVTGKLEAWAPHAEVIHVEIDPSCVSKNVFADCAILGHVADVLEALEPHVEAGDTGAWLDQIGRWRGEVEAAPSRTDGALGPLEVVQKLGARAGDQGVLTTDVGQHQMWAAQGFGFDRTRSHITSGGLGTMGFGFPAAIGAALGLRGTDAVVVSINGDGGFLMNCQELGVAAKHKLPIKLAVLNNSRLGMVRQWQELFFGERYSETDTSDTNPDFVALAEAFGLRRDAGLDARGGRRRHRGRVEGHRPAGPDGSSSSRTRRWSSRWSRPARRSDDMILRRFSEE